MWFGDLGLGVGWGFLRLVRLSFAGHVYGCCGAINGIARPLSVLVRRVPPGCGILVGSVLVRVRGGSGGIIWLWVGGRSVRSLCARLSSFRVVRRYGSKFGLGVSAFSSTFIRWSGVWLLWCRLWGCASIVGIGLCLVVV